MVLSTAKPHRLSVQLRRHLPATLSPHAGSWSHGHHLSCLPPTYILSLYLGLTLNVVSDDLLIMIPRDKWIQKEIRGQREEDLLFHFVCPFCPHDLTPSCQWEYCTFEPGDWPILDHNPAYVREPRIWDFGRNPWEGGAFSPALASSGYETEATDGDPATPQQWRSQHCGKQGKRSRGSLGQPPGLSVKWAHLTQSVLINSTYSHHA